MKVKSYNYYRVRSMVRFCFWSSLSLGFVWLLSFLFADIDNYTCHNTQATVGYGDTLWSVVERNCDGNIQEAVYRLIDLRETEIVRLGEVVQLTSNK